MLEAISQIDKGSLVALARDLGNISSDRDNEGEIAGYISDRLRKAGLSVHSEEVVAGRPNVIVRVDGSDNTQLPLVLNGHMDGSYHLGGWSKDPLDGWVDGDRLFGGAISDMKGGLAAMVMAVETAARLNYLPRPIILHSVMHHDTVGLGTKYVLASEGPYAGYGICGEPTNMAIHFAHGGAVKFRITVTGKAAHVSRIEDGIDSLKAAVKIYSQIPEMKLQHEKNPMLDQLPRVLVGVMISGFAAGCTSPSTTLLGDVRTLPDMNRHTVLEDLKNLVEEFALPDCTYKVEITAAQKAFVGDAHGSLASALQSVTASVRGEASPLSTSMPVQGFVTDAADMAAIGIESLVFGPGDWKYQPDEFISISDMVDAAKIYLGTAFQLPTR
jgi:acetylornithine deacetylase/succinyl-diaminopimelate desuccinylase-like protein